MSHTGCVYIYTTFASMSHVLMSITVQFLIKNLNLEYLGLRIYIFYICMYMNLDLHPAPRCTTLADKDIDPGSLFCYIYVDIFTLVDDHIHILDYQDLVNRSRSYHICHPKPNFENPFCVITSVF
ncbi:hypothetical protein HanIR_Chr17g0870071 [Helianthus annuus]|nr:hypothetical protein HanIR_Chr17g0870071 [Helianthus annuus]